MATDFKRILVRRGEGALPSDLQTGEFALKTDTDTLFIKGNIDVLEIAKDSDLDAAVERIATAETTLTNVGTALSNFGQQQLTQNTAIAANTTAIAANTTALANVYTKSEIDSQRVPVRTEIVNALSPNNLVASSSGTYQISDFDEFEILTWSTNLDQAGISLVDTDVKRMRKEAVTWTNQDTTFKIAVKHNQFDSEVTFKSLDNDNDGTTESLQIIATINNAYSNYPSFTYSIYVYGIKY
jgi:hypothetical protein